LLATTRANADTTRIVTYSLRFFIGLLTASCVLLCVVACGDRGVPVLTRILEAQRISAELLVQFDEASDAANRAVMADTDEVSKASAAEAEQHNKAIAAGVDALAPILRELSLSDEATLLQQFRDAYARYRTLDSEILALAVENTNLKAQRLSFGEAHAAANAVRAALDRIMKSDATRARALATSVVLAVREIEVMQAPHIAAAEDAVMNQLEHDMGMRQTEAHALLTELAGVGGTDITSAVEAANQALQHFGLVNDQLIALSRRNSNVRSLALTLGQKHTLTAACQASLVALRERLQKRDFKATR
jgi:hypothetical protein